MPICIKDPNSAIQTNEVKNKILNFCLTLELHYKYNQY